VSGPAPAIPLDARPKLSHGVRAQPDIADLNDAELDILLHGAGRTDIEGGGVDQLSRIIIHWTHRTPPPCVAACPFRCAGSTPVAIPLDQSHASVRRWPAVALRACDEMAIALSPTSLAADRQVRSC
jgi:hypothetical protein